MVILSLIGTSNATLLIATANAVKAAVGDVLSIGWVSLQGVWNVI